MAEGGLAKVGDLTVVGALYELFLTEAKIISAEKIADLSQKDFEGVVAAHPFHKRPGSEGYFDYDVPLYFGEFVTTEAGTGFVHIAPGHGEDDFNLGQKYKIKFEETVGAVGTSTPWWRMRDSWIPPEETIASRMARRRWLWDL